MGCGYGKLGISSEGDEDECHEVEEFEEQVARKRKRRRRTRNKKQPVSNYKGSHCPPEKERERLQFLTAEQERQRQLEQEPEEQENQEAPQRHPQRNGLLQAQEKDKRRPIVVKIKPPIGDSPLKPQLSRSESQMDFFRMLDEKIAKGKDYESDQDNDLADGRWRRKNSQSPPPHSHRVVTHDLKCPSAQDTDAAPPSPGGERRKRGHPCFCAVRVQTCNVSGCD